MTESPLILIAEDDEAIATGLAMNLRLEGYRSRIVTDGAAALTAVDAEPPALLLLDIGMPEKDGLEVLRELREGGNRTPVIVLSARGNEYDKVVALRLGADDYVTKPFALAELMARVDAVLRRAPAASPAKSAKVVRFGSVAVELATRQVLMEDRVIAMTHLEFELLRFFLEHPSRVLGRKEILEQVWGTSGSPRTVDNFVGQLRAKLELDAEQPKHFVTVRGSGYRFDP